MAETLKIASYGQGLPLVFIHGWGLNSGIWQPLVEQLSANYKVITVDLPGFGLNVEQQLSLYSIDNVVALVADVIDEPAVIIGWSLGGLVATQLACRFPEKAKALVTVASSPFFIEQVADNKTELSTIKTQGDTELANWPGIKAQILASFHQMLSTNIEKTINNFLKIQAMGSEHVRSDIKRIKELVMAYPLPNKTTLDRSLMLLESVDVRAQLADISIPFLRLYGKLDSLVPKKVIDLVSELQPNSEHYVFAKASHAPFISHQQEFLTVLTDWLEQQNLIRI